MLSETKICAWCMAEIPQDAKVCPRCGYNGSQRNPVGALALGTTLAGRYHIGRYLKVDGEGITYLAYDETRREALRIKEYYPANLCQARTADNTVVPRQGAEVLYKTTMMDFTEVYKNAAKYQQCPNFMGVYGLVNENGTVYAIRELSKGVSLAAYLENLSTVLDCAAAMNLLEPIFDAVQTLHDDNMLHRGISPETIIILPSGKAVLSGYATQAMRTEGSTLTSTVYKGYTAPEQYNAAEYQGTFTDIYALAAVLYTCITGTVPPKASERRIADDFVPANKAGGGKVSPRQAEVIGNAMALEPGQRPKTVTEFASYLNGSYKPEVRKAAPILSLSSIQRQILAGVGVCVSAVVIIWLVVQGIFNMGQGGITPVIGSDISSSDSVDASKTEVDDFVGLLYSDIEANRTLQMQYLFVTETAFNETYKAGVVISQTPAPLTPYQQGQVIRLIISKGPETADVPNLVGESSEAAISLLNSLGIPYEIVPIMGDGSIAVGHVSGTDKLVGMTIKIATEKLIVYVVQSVPTSSESSSTSVSIPPQSSSAPESTSPQSSSVPESTSTEVQSGP